MASCTVAAAAEKGPQFEEAASRAGIRFVHETGGTGEKYIVETVGSGACFLDYDGDGDDDLYLVQGAALPGFTSEGAPHNSLYRNEGPGPGGVPRFVEVTDAAGVGDTSWGMGCAAADVDGDADPDLFVSNFGPDVFYRNDGDGTFTDATSAAGLGDPRFASSTAFGDADGDGYLDLYVTSYVNFTIENHQACGVTGEGMVSYCHPNVYGGAPDILYRNRGDGTFRDATTDLGAVRWGHGLGVIWSDLDDDGRLDIFVANDDTPNFLFRNQGDGTFREVALLRGVAVNEDGNSESGMGVESADLDGDGWFDLFLTHLDMQTNTLYHNLGGGRFVDWSLPSGVGRPSLLHVGFGNAAIDFDLDADLDIILTNGHVLDDVAETVWETVSYAEPMHLLVNDGRGRYREAGKEHGAIFSEQIVGRALALADVDRDGDLDIAVTESHGPARLLLASGAVGRWMQIDLEQAGPNRRAVGAKVTVITDDRRQVREVRCGSSYLSRHALTLHAGLGTARAAGLEVRWPDGARVRFERVPAEHRYWLPRASRGSLMTPVRGVPSGEKAE